LLEEDKILIDKSNGDERRTNFWLDVFILVLKKKKVIFACAFLIMSITALYLLTLDKWYESKAIILLPEKSSSPLDALSGSLGIGASVLGINAPANTSRYIAIVSSRRLREDLIDHYNLKESYGVEKVDDALRILEKDLVADTDRKLGTIVITFHFFGDADKTAEMTNYVVAKLDEINRELATEQAKFTRKFIEDRYLQAKQDLKITEDSLNSFQKKYSVISIPEQTKAAIEAAAKLQAQYVAKETEYNVKKKTLGSNHPDLQLLESELQELRKSQNQMENGGMDLSIFIPFKKTPDLAMSYIRLFRDVQINGKIVEFLMPQYEQAKIQEAKDTPTLLVLDTAKAADYSYKPRRTVITLTVGVLTCIVMILLLYFREYQLNEWTERNKEFNTMLTLLKPSNWFK